MTDFLSLCSDAGIDSEKNVMQIKEKWRTIFDKYKTAKDNNNKTGRDRKTFEYYDDMDEFLSGSDKVNPKFVKETKLQRKAKDNTDDPDCETGGDELNDDPTTAVVVKEKGNEGAGEKPTDAKNAACPPKKKPQKRKRPSLDTSDAETSILNLMEAQQAAIEKADEKDERMFETLLKSQNDSQQRHQEFTLSVLGKLGEIFSSKK